MTRGIIAGIIAIGAIFGSTAAFADGSGERVVKQQGRKIVWAAKKEARPYALVGNDAKESRDEKGAQLRSFGRSGYHRR